MRGAAPPSGERRWRRFRTARAMSPLEIGILGLYFLTLVDPGGAGHSPLPHGLPLLPVPRPARAPRAAAGRAAPRHRPAPHLQRDVRGGAPARVRGAASATPRSCSRSRSSTTPPTRPQAIARRAVERYRAAGLRHPLPPPHRPHRLQGGRARRPGSAWPRASSSSSSTPTSWPPRHPGEDGGPLHRPQGGDGAGALGPHQPRLLAPDPGAVDHARRALRPRARRAATAPAASSTSTAPPASGGAAAIDDAGGWQHDTLTEDLDLSYRAQMKGWRFVYLQDVVCPAELPVEMNAFKSQQHRWAKGSVQTCLKLLPARPGLAPAARHQDRVGLPPHRQLRLSADGAALAAHVPGHGHPLQHGPGTRC